MKNDNWTSENIPDQSGKVAIVTGASSGIGYEAARIMANKGASVIIAVRSLDKGNAAASKIVAQNKDADVTVMLLDLADLASVKAFAGDIKAKQGRLDLLVNNAGVMIPPYAQTADGFELQFGTNHLGHFALTAQLYGLLEGTDGSRIVNVSSGAHTAGHLDFDDLTWEKRRYRAWSAYGDSKIANLYFTYELDRRLKAAGSRVKAIAAHPGWTATDLQRHSSLINFLNGFFAQSIAMGTLPTLRAAFDPAATGGEYYGPGGFRGMRGYPVEVQSNELSHDAAIADRLWQVSEALTGVTFDAGKKSEVATA